MDHPKRAVLGVRHHPGGDLSTRKPEAASAERRSWVRRQFSAGLDPSRPRRARLEARRRLWLDVHLWLGLLVGGFLAIIGLSGSALVFFMELDEALNPSLLLADPAPRDGPRIPVERVVDATTGHVEGWRLAGVLAPRNDGANWDVWFDRPGVDPDAGNAIREVLVDPSSGRVHGTRDRDPGRWLPPSLVSFLFVLHDSLLVPWHGERIVGFLAVVLLVSVGSGIIVWWPLGGSWLTALRPRRRLRGQRLNLELHRLSGAWTAVVLATVLASGISMNLHDEFVWLVRLASPGAEAPRPVTSGPARGREALGLDAAFVRAWAAYPSGRLHSVVAPDGPDGVFTVTLHDVPGTSRFWAERVITVDAHSGEIIDVRDATNRRTGGDAVLEWQWPLHSGQAFGWPGRLAVFLAGLACPLLFVTGVVRWGQKRRGRTRALPT